MYERFTDRARKVMQLAHHEANRLNREYIGTEHILLALIQIGNGVAAEVFKSSRISARTVREQIDRILDRGMGERTAPIGGLPLTPRAELALKWAEEEARFLSHDFVCTEHLLMGLLHESEGVAHQVLLHLGLTVDRAREEVMRLSPPGRREPAHA